MSIELTVKHGERAVVTVRIPAGRPPREATHVRVSDRGAAALGWNRLYATLMAHVQQSGSTGNAIALAQELMRALGEIDGVQPTAITLADLRYLLANLATLAKAGRSNVVLAENLLVQPMVSLLDVKEQDLGDPYSPVDEPDPSFAEAFFAEATRAQRQGRYEGWWSPIEREALPAGVPAGFGRLEALGASSSNADDAPLRGDWSDLDIDDTHRLIYLGQERILDWAPSADASQYRVWMFDRSALHGDPVLHPLVDQQAWSTIDAGHELLWLGRDLNADPHSTDDLVLDWVPATGNYRLYRVDLDGTKDDRGTPDVLPEPPLARGNWTAIRATKKLSYLGGNRVLDWEPATGDFRIWVLDRRASGAADPLSTLELQGNWETIREGHQIIHLGGDRVLTWFPATAWYRVWHYDRSVKGNGDPLSSPPLAQGHWEEIDGDHELIWFGGRHVLDWQPASSGYCIRNFDRTASDDPLT